MTVVRLTLAEQADKLGRILDERVAHYRRAVQKDRATVEWGAQKHAECEDIRRTFAWLLANHDWIKAEAQRREAAARQRADLAELERDPVVRAVLETFPGSTIAAATQRMEPA